MLENELQTTRDLIYYRLANLKHKNNIKIVSGFGENSFEKENMIKQLFNELKNNGTQWLDPRNGDSHILESESKCIHCNSSENVSLNHIVPKSLKIVSKCRFCNIVQGAHNLVWICNHCREEKGLKGLYEFYKTKYPDNKNFYDLIPPLLEQKYLQTMFCCHKCAGTLDRVDINEDGKVDVLDIDSIISCL